MGTAEAAGFDRLMSLTIAHEYYRDAAGDACPDFEIEPTGPTRLLMTTLGLELRIRPHGIDLFYDRGRAQGLLRYLANRRQFRAERRHQRDADTGCWTRLTLTLRPRNPLFANFTDTPLGFSPIRHALYLTNRRVGEAAGGPIPLRHDWNGNTVQASHGTASAAGPTLPIPVDTARLVVANTSTAVVLQMSRTAVPPIPHHLPSYVLGGTGDAAAWASVPMIGLPSGLYFYTAFAAGGRPAAEGRFLHIAEGERVFALIDLFLASPGDDDGLFPVDMPDGGDDFADAIDRIRPRDYIIRFGARQTCWVYHVVPPVRGADMSDLRIDGDGAAAFTGPESETLPDGTPAWRFSADRALSLQRRSGLGLRLRGAGRTLLDRLPTASADALRLPAAAGGGDGPPWPADPPVHSDIYVYL